MIKSNCLPQNSFISSPIFKDAVDIVLTLKKEGFLSYFVGGAVRDMLLGIEPKEIDIVTEADSDAVEAIFKRTVATGKQFGVIRVMVGENGFEVASCRKDGEYKDGRRPESVSRGTFIDDIKRRDFTINGMLYDPISCEIIDYENGESDLKNRIIRTIGNPDERFSEDHLRIMRAIRFACRFDFKIDDSVFNAIRKFAHLINKISAERIRDELIKMLTAQNNGKALFLLKECGILSEILPEVMSMVGVEQPKQFHPEGDVFTHTKLMFDYSQNPTPELAMGILLHDIGKVETFEVTDRIRFNNHWIASEKTAKNILSRLKFSNDSIKTILELVIHHMRFRNVKEMKESKLKRFILMDNFDLHLELHRLDCLASHGMLDNYYFTKEKYNSLNIKDKNILKKPIVTGDDLIALGLAPSPLFRQIIEFIKDSELEGKIKTKAEGLELIKKQFSLNFNI